MRKFLIACVLAPCILIVFSSSSIDARRWLHHHHEEPKPKDDDVTFAYACGYRAGQNAVMTLWGPLISKAEIEIVPIMPECEPMKRRATKNGFNP